MEMLFHEATQPISGDILHQRQDNRDCRPECRDVSLFGQRLCLHHGDQSKKKQGSFFFPLSVLCFVQAWRIWFCSKQGCEKTFIRNDWPESHLRLGLKPGRSMKLTARLEDSVVTQSPVTSEARSCALNLSLTLSVSRWKCSSSENREKSVGSCMTSNILSYGLPLVIRSTTCSK